MQFLVWFKAVNRKQKESVVESLIKDATPDFDFYLLTFLSVLMASFGVILNSEAVVIGSMLIAPVMSPILALGLGFIANSQKLISRSLYTIFKVIVTAVIVSFFANLIFGGSFVSDFNTVISRIEPSFLHVAVAIVSGLAVSYSLIRKELSASLPGVAVAVSLMPPLAVSGIALSYLDFAAFSGALLIFIYNIIGIVAVSMIAFFVMGFADMKGYVHIVLSTENKRLKEEKQESEKLKKEFEKDLALNKENDSTENKKN